MPRSMRYVLRVDDRQESIKKAQGDYTSLPPAPKPSRQLAGHAALMMPRMASRASYLSHLGKRLHDNPYTHSAEEDDQRPVVPLAVIAHCIHSVRLDDITIHSFYTYFNSRKTPGLVQRTKYDYFISYALTIFISLATCSSVT